MKYKTIYAPNKYCVLFGQVENDLDELHVSFSKIHAIHDFIFIWNKVLV